MFDVEKVREQIEGLTEGEQVAIWNEYCENVNCFDDEILENDLDELLVDRTPSEVWNSISSDYHDSDNYCTFNGYGLLVSYSYLDDSYSPFDIEALVDWIVDNEDTLGYFSAYDVEVEEDEEDGEE